MPAYTISELIVIHPAMCTPARHPDPGVFFSSWLGEALLGIGEWLIRRLPLVKHIYSASKQVCPSVWCGAALCLVQVSMHDGFGQGWSGWDWDACSCAWGLLPGLNCHIHFGLTCAVSAVFAVGRLIGTHLSPDWPAGAAHACQAQHIACT